MTTMMTATFAAPACSRPALCSRWQAGRSVQPSWRWRQSIGRETACKSTAGTDAATTPPAQADADSPSNPCAVADAWASFAENVSGEWEGTTASFSADGSAIPLPEYYVPQAYRDWGVELVDWQSQSSMLATQQDLTATSRRIMPTVGCEADAIAYTQDACKLFDTSATGAATPTVAAEGSFSHGPAGGDLSPADCFKAALEQCLVMQPRQRRLRVVHNLHRVGAAGAWELDSIELHQERYESPHHGKVELLGCGGGMKGFAADERLAAEELQGRWAASGVRYLVNGGDCHCQAVSAETWSAEGLAAGALMLHPLKAWSACDIKGDSISVAAGVLLDEPGSMALVTRKLVAGRLVSAELLTLQRD